jgi:hypothetical protein
MYHGIKRKRGNSRLVQKYKVKYQSLCIIILYIYPGIVKKRKKYFCNIPKPTRLIGHNIVNNKIYN